MLNKLKALDSTFVKVAIGFNLFLICGSLPLSLIWAMIDEYTAPIVFVSMIGAGIVLMFDLIIAGYFYFIARDKGYKNIVYLAFAYIIPPIGQLLIIAMPDRGIIPEKSVSAGSFDDLPEI